MSDHIVALAGDWHGNTVWAQDCIRAAARLGAERIYHLGDFGIWPGDKGRAYVRHVDAAAKHFGIDIWVTLGNHEDYDQVAAIKPNADDGLPWLTDRILLMPRGFRWTNHGRSFVSLGGAPSIDFEGRVEGVSWWRAEMITPAEATAVAEAGYADVMLAHDAPDGSTRAVVDIISTPPDKSPWSAVGLTYAAEGRELMNVAYDGVKPKLFAHGHYHVADDTGPGDHRFVALAGDGMRGNLALLRLDDLAISWDGRAWSPTESRVGA